jgi:hypothetical protein
MREVLIFAAIFIIFVFAIIFIWSYNIVSQIAAPIDAALNESGYYTQEAQNTRNLLAAVYRYGPILFLFFLIFWAFYLITKREKYEIVRV